MTKLVHGIISKRPTVGFKRVWMRGVSEEHIRWIRNERTTKQTDPFQDNPLGRGQLADFPSRGRGTHSSRIDLDMLVVTASLARTALKISQLTDGGMSPTYDTMHHPSNLAKNGLSEMGLKVRPR